MAVPWHLCIYACITMSLALFSHPHLQVLHVTYVHESLEELIMKVIVQMKLGCSHLQAKVTICCVSHFTHFQIKLECDLLQVRYFFEQGTDEV